jgi:hypothetical protein
VDCLENRWPIAIPNSRAKPYTEKTEESADSNGHSKPPQGFSFGDRPHFPQNEGFRDHLLLPGFTRLCPEANFFPVLRVSPAAFKKFFFTEIWE